MLKRGVKAWNAWRKKNADVFPDLRGADLSEGCFEHFDLSNANLRRANLTAATLDHSNLSSADLVYALLTSATLNAAKLSGAYLTGADLAHARLKDADLTWTYMNAANLTDAELAGADFTGASIWNTVFGGVDLSTVKGLEEVNHDGPSVIGVDVIYRSNGRIPKRFLQGAGLSDNFIAQMDDIVNSGSSIQFYSCFISYSTKDQEFADRLYEDLQSEGVRCWFAPHDVRAGKKLHEQIDRGISLCDRLLIILSDNSMNSEWVKTEIAHARQKEMNERRQVLFPIAMMPFARIREWKCFDADTGKDSAREIREYFIPDLPPK